MGNQEQSTATQPIKLDVRAYPIAEPKGNVVGFASVTIADMVAVNGIRVMNGEKGLFAAMPSAKDSKGEYRDVAFPVTSDLRKQLNSAVLEAYAAAKEKAQEKPSVSDQIKGAAKEKPVAKEKAAPDKEKAAPKKANPAL